MAYPRKTLEQLQRQYAHYQRMYRRANAEGKSLLKTQLSKLQKQIQTLDEWKEMVGKSQDSEQGDRASALSDSRS